MSSTISGITPSGHMQLGNYLGAARRWATGPQEGALYFVSDLHAFTTDHDPASIRTLARETFVLLIACRIDPERATVFVQSDVPAHTELSYLMECTATYGEMRRMIQFKEKSAGQESVRLSLLTYPALMAADILAYDAKTVPVGDDQNQHVELARDLAIRFNRRYGETFVVPRAVPTPVAARVRDLQRPHQKMSKSASDASGVIRMLDAPGVIRDKIRRAVTDSDGEVRYDPQAKPGVSNLLEILAAAIGTTPSAAEAGLSSYARLKEATADAVIALLEPPRRRYDELAADPSTVDKLRRLGAERARALSAPTLRRARRAIGLTAEAG